MSLASSREGRRAFWAAGALSLCAYLATMATTTTWWDAGEFIAAAETLGIPHPPGAPLVVLLGRVMVVGLAPVGVGAAAALALLSALCSAAAAGVLGALVARRLGDAVTGVAAGLGVALGSSVWRNATEGEVYAVALLLAALLLDAAERRRWGLMAYWAALAPAVSLLALVAVPAAVVLGGVRSATRAWREPRVWIGLVVGVSVLLVLLVRARHDPWLNSGDPSTWERLWAVVTRAQYENPGLWPRRAPRWAQLANVGQWLDQQIALGVSATPAPSAGRALLTVAWLLCAVVGLRRWWARDRRGAIAVLVLALCGTVGAALWLNLKLGPSFGVMDLVAGVPREARERDYFFVLGFAAIGMMAAAAWRPRVALVVALLPAALNWRAVNRRAEPEASVAARFARNALEALPPRAVLLAEGDNEVYPLWAEQGAGRRRDVTVVIVPLLPAAWYRDELARRERWAVGPWTSERVARERVVAMARAAGRPVYRSALYDLPPEPCRLVDASCGTGHMDRLTLRAEAAMVRGAVVVPVAEPGPLTKR